jgi:hypothetical protein
LDDVNLHLNFNYFDLNGILGIQNDMLLELSIDIRDKLHMDIDLRTYFKFNPSIVSLDESRFLISYRIYIGQKLDCDNYDTMNNCHYWYSMWNSIIHQGWDIPNLKLNLLCFAITDTNFNVITDVICKSNDGMLGIEDVRLFKSGDDIYCEGTITKGMGDPIGPYHDIRYVRKVIGLIDLNTFNIDFSIVCENQQQQEKNWTFLDLNSEVYAIYNTYPSYFPLRLLKLTNVVPIEDTNYVDEGLTKIRETIFIDDYRNMVIDYYNDTTSVILCDEITSTRFNPFFNRINESYYPITNGEKALRLSGGTPAISIDQNYYLMVNHIVVNLASFVNLDNMDQLDRTTQNNVYKFLFQRDYELVTPTSVLRYFMMFCVYDITLNNIQYYSYPFNIVDETQNYQVNFPTGLDIVNDIAYISFGTNDMKCTLITMYLNDILNSVLPTNHVPQSVPFVTFSQDGEQLF